MSELPKNMKELLRHFPRKIPKRFCKEIDRRAKTDYIFCRSKEDRQKAVCTACGKDIIIPAYCGHNSECECPNCRRRLYVASMAWYEESYPDRYILPLWQKPGG